LINGSFSEMRAARKRRRRTNSETPRAPIWGPAATIKETHVPPARMKEEHRTQRIAREAEEQNDEIRDAEDHHPG